MRRAPPTLRRRLGRRRPRSMDCSADMDMPREIFPESSVSCGAPETRFAGWIFKVNGMPTVRVELSAHSIFTLPINPIFILQFKAILDADRYGCRYDGENRASSYQ